MFGATLFIILTMKTSHTKHYFNKCSKYRQLLNIVIIYLYYIILYFILYSKNKKKIETKYIIA